MPNQPEQGTFDLGDKQRPKPSSDPDTFDGVRRTIAGGRHGVRPNPTDPLLVGSKEEVIQPEKKDIPPYTHTVPKGREVWCLDSDPGRATFATRTNGTLHVAETGQTRLVALRGRKPEYAATEPFTTHASDGTPFDHSVGTHLVTPYAIRRKPIGMRQPPSTRLEQR